MIYCLFPADKYSFDCSNLNKIRVKIQNYNNALLVKKTIDGECYELLENKLFCDMSGLPFHQKLQT